MKRLAILVALGVVACGGSETPQSPTRTASTSNPPGSPTTTPTTTPPGTPAFAWNECGLNTGYEGDDRCILPPPADKGFQAHYGPTDYDNPESGFVLNPGDESTVNFPATTPNDTDVYFYYRQYRLRPTAHHVILSVPSGGTSIAGLGRRVGTANTSQDFPVGGEIAPEDQHVGLPLAPHSVITANFHAINTADTPQLREAWINFWYRDPNEITEPAIEWFKVGDFTVAVAPHTSTTLGPYMCDVQNDGRMLWLYGHRHANNVRFTVNRIRNGQTDVIYDANKWEEPILLEYSSTVTNKAPDIANGVEGGWNGILDLVKGDKIQWSCDVVNNHDTALRFTEQTLLGEMCIVDAEAVTSTCSGL